MGMERYTKRKGIFGALDVKGASRFRGNLQLDGTSIASATNAIVAVDPGAQSTATLLTTELNRVVTVANAAAGVKLPVSAAGMRVVVTNAHASNAINVYPNTGDAINAIAANSPFSVAATKTAVFYCMVAGTWNTLLTA